MAVAVLDTHKQILAPTTSKRAHQLLTRGQAAVWRRFPFTIILKHVVQDVVLPDLVEKIDPGSTTTGISIVNQTTGEIIFAAELTHQGELIKDNLRKRKGVRGGRRQRKTRYRRPSFKAKKKYLNRKGHNKRGLPENGGNRILRITACANKVHPQGWLPPSIISRLTNTLTWDRRLRAVYPIASRALEDVKFDTQLLENPDICGIEYQQGTLAGYNVREYVLIRDKHKCVYCGAKNVPLQLDHITPRSRNGSNRVSNLCAACQPCNQRKNNLTAAEFGFPELQKQVRERRLAPAAHMNAIRHRLRDAFHDLPLITGSGARTKMNRITRGLPKTHWLDAACVGEEIPVRFKLPTQVLLIKAMGYGNRKKCRVDERGFPVAHRSGARDFQGWKTGDMAIARTPKGTFTGRVVIRQRPSFTINKIDVHPKYLTRIHRKDGYGYEGLRVDKQMALAASTTLPA